MMTDASAPILSLPKEVRVILFSYLDQRNLRSFRGISKWAEHDIRYGRLFAIPSCTFSDDFLRSEARVNQLTICNLMQPKLITPICGGRLMKHVLEIVLRRNIDPENLKKILENVDRVRKICFQSAGRPVLKEFIKFNRTYQHIRTLELFLGIQKYVYKFFTSLVEQTGVMFPNLEKLNFGWDKHDKYWEDSNPGWKIYFALHKLLWIHRKTIKSVKWDFGQLEEEDDFVSLHHSTGDEMNELRNLLVQILDVNQLQDVEIRTPNWENVIFSDTDETYFEDIWKLSTRLLSAHIKLVNLSYKPLKFKEFEISVMETIGLKIAKTIQKLHLCPRSSEIEPIRLNQLASYSILKDLQMLQIIYRPTDIIFLPPSLTSLSITIGDAATIVADLNNIDDNIDLTVALQPYREVLAWITINMKRLIRLELILEGLFFLTAVEFKTLINSLTDLVDLEIIFPRKILDSMKSVKAVSIGKKGISVKLILVETKLSSIMRRLKMRILPDKREFLRWEDYSDTYILKWKINRNTFKDFILD